MEGYEGKRFMAAHFAIENMIARYVVYIYIHICIGASLLKMCAIRYEKRNKNLFNSSTFRHCVAYMFTLNLIPLHDFLII